MSAYQQENFHFIKEAHTEPHNLFKMIRMVDLVVLKAINKCIIYSIRNPFLICRGLGLLEG